MTTTVEPYLSWHEQQEEIKRLRDQLLILELEKAEYIRIYQKQIDYYKTRLRRAMSQHFTEFDDAAS